MNRKSSKSNHWAADLIAGLTAGIANIPDAMASAILAGTNPVYGLYALMTGTPVGALLTSSHFLAVAVTSAMALIVGSILAEVASEDQTAALAGIIFSLLLGTSGVLIQLSIPPVPPYDTDWLSEQADRASLAVTLIPFAGIAFLWFKGVIRDQLGELEDQFFSTIFFCQHQLLDCNWRSSARSRT